MSVRRAALLLGAIAGALDGCSSDCHSSDECASDEVCRAGLCRPRGDSTGGRRVRDGSVADASAPVDAGVADGGGGDSADAGGTPDGGATFPGDATALMNEGLAVIGELVAGPSETHFPIFAEFRDYATAIFVESTRNYSLGNDGDCALHVRHLIGGTVGGIEADRVEIRGLPNPKIPPVLVLMRTAPGFYSTSTSELNRGLFFGAGEVTFEIFGSGLAATLEGATARVSVPPDVQFMSPPYDTPVSASSPIALAWMPASSPSGMIIIELADGPGEVRLSCTSPDDGAFALSDAARLDWLAQSPQSPGTLDLRYEERLVESVAITGGGTLPVHFRVTRGVRYVATW